MGIISSLRTLSHLVVLVVWTGHAASAAEPFDSRLRAAGERLARANGAVAGLDSQQRERVVEFTVGNALFTLSHELGHTLVSEFDLPVLGREEDAADMFATLALLHVGTDVAHGVLVNAARGLFLSAERETRKGQGPAFYGEHGLNQQRAYQIVCLMVGSDPDRFKDLARQVSMPDERQETCQQDYEQAKASWVRLLEPHFRHAASPNASFWERLLRPRSRDGTRPRPDMEAIYGEATGDLAPYRDVLETVGVLEIVRDFTVKNFAFRRGIVLEAKGCGGANAYWDPIERRLTFCYELTADAVELALSDSGKAIERPRGR